MRTKNLEGRNSVLTVEYLSSLIAAIRIFESSVKQNSAKDWLSEMYTRVETLSLRYQ